MDTALEDNMGLTTEVHTNWEEEGIVQMEDKYSNWAKN